MLYSRQSQGFPISITYLSKLKPLFTEQMNSKTTLGAILEHFKNNLKYKNLGRPKTKYVINGKEINKNQTLEEIISQNNFDPKNVEILLELDDNQSSGDISNPIYTKILQPKENPFGLFVYAIQDGTLKLQTFPEKTINLFELNLFNEGSSFCNSKDDLYISGSKGNENKNFWIINNKDFNIKKKNMPFSKQNHSMIYLNLKENEEWIFIIGGNDKKSFYYDLNKNYFINWGDTFDLHLNPALIKIGEYLYIFDSLNENMNYFERTKVINPTRKWEKIIPSIDKKLIQSFPSNFGVSHDINGNILFLGGDNIKKQNNTYIYNPNNNEILSSKNGTNDNITFSDKTFYNVNKRYNITLPKDLIEIKEICLVDKERQTLIKINTEIPKEHNEIKIKSTINFGDKKYLINKKEEGSLTIKELSIKNNGKREHYKNINNATKQQYICNNCEKIKNMVCNVCHKNIIGNNYEHEKTHKKTNNKKYPYIENIYDEYYPTYEKKKYISNFKQGHKDNKAKVEIIYDEYIPIKVDYELGKPYVFKYNKSAKKYENNNNKGEEQINDKNEIKFNLIKENKEENKEYSKEKNELKISDGNKGKNNINIENKKIMEDQQDKLEPYINEEENAEQENEEIEEQYKNQIEEKSEENNEQIQEHNYYKQYKQKNEEKNPPLEIMKDSLEEEEEIKKDIEINEVNKKQELKKDDIFIIKPVSKGNKIDESDLIKPYLKLNYGFKEENNGKDEENFNIIKGLKVNFDDDIIKYAKQKQIQTIITEKKEEKKIEENDLIKPYLKLNYGFKEESNEKDEEDFNIVKGLKINFNIGNIKYRKQNEDQKIIADKKEEKKVDENDLIKPYLKLNYGIKEEKEVKNEEDFNIVKGLKINFDNDNIKYEKQKEIQKIFFEKKEEKKLNESDLIKPYLKLNYGFKEENEVKDEEDANIFKGLKVHFDNDTVKYGKYNNNQKLTQEKTNDIVQNQQKEENKEFNEINEDEVQNNIHQENNVGENQNIEQNNEEVDEEIHYENHENDNNENGIGIGDMESKDNNFEEEENINEEEQEFNYEEEQKDVMEVDQEKDNENQIEEEIQEDNDEVQEDNEEDN